MVRCITVPLWEKLLCFKDVHFKLLRKYLTEEYFFLLCGTTADGSAKEKWQYNTKLLEIVTLWCILTQEQLNGWIQEIKRKQQL